MFKHSLVPDGQPLVIKCSLEKSFGFKSGDCNLTWYKVGNKTAVPRDKLARIHQQKSLIWFLPAILEDSGNYECVIRWKLKKLHCYRNVLQTFRKKVGFGGQEKCCLRKYVTKTNFMLGNGSLIYIFFSQVGKTCKRICHVLSSLSSKRILCIFELENM